MRWVKLLLVAVVLLAPIGLVVLVAWPSSGAEEGNLREDGSGADGALLAGDEVGTEIGFGEVAEYRAIGTGEVLRIDVSTALGLDFTLTVLDDDGQQLAYNDDTNGLNPQVTVEVADGEEVVIQVRELGGNAGSFTLSVAGGDFEAGSSEPGRAPPNAVATTATVIITD